MMRRVLPSLAPLCCLLAAHALPCHAVTRPGAPRVLPLSFGGESRADGGAASLVSDAVPVGAGNAYTVLFASSGRGTRNIYRATPVRRVPNKPPVWSAQALTLLGAPNFVNAPAPFPDGKSALCVVGTFNDDQNREAVNGKEAVLRGTIARLDLASGALETVIADTRCSDPAPSPDGRRLAWSAERSGTESVWVALLDGERFRVASKARHPVWLDAKTLVYESVDGGRRGIYRVTLKPDGSVLGDTRRQLWPYGGEIAVSPDGDTLCIATQSAAASNGARGVPALTRLYVLSSDGSGARILAGTEGARHPHWLPDSSGVVYDAPLPNDKGLVLNVTGAPHSLWLLPMRSTPPVAVLIEARPSLLDTRLVEVYGTAWCEGDNAPQVKLEVGRGDDPQQWNSLPAGNPPIQQGIVGRWMPTADANGTWTLRLTVTANSGETTQNLLPVTLPLIAAPVLGSPVGGLPPADSFKPPVAADNPLAPVIPKRQPGRGTVAPMPLENLPPRMPSPDTRPGVLLPPPVAPPAAPPKTTAPVSAPPATAGDTSEADVPPTLPPADVLPPVGNPPGSGSASGYPPLVLRPLPRKTATRPREPRKTRSGKRNDKKPVAPPAPVSDHGDAARIDVAGTPAEMEVAETLEVVATLRNKGRTTWTASGDSPVRLLVRWTDMTGGYRVRWAIVWPQTPTRPDQTAQVRFTVTAPSRPGRYKVTYALLRVPGGVVQQPRETGDTPWPGEFGGAAYEVVVK